MCAPLPPERRFAGGLLSLETCGRGVSESASRETRVPASAVHSDGRGGGPWQCRFVTSPCWQSLRCCAGREDSLRGVRQGEAWAASRQPDADSELPDVDPGEYGEIPPAPSEGGRRRAKDPPFLPGIVEEDGVTLSPV